MIVHSADADSADARRLMIELSSTLAAITGDDGTSSFDTVEMQAAGARFAIATNSNGEAVGCGGFRPLDEGIAEIKRMFAVPGTRGVGTAVLAFLESEAARMGYRALWLSTRHVNERAVAFYQARGYQRVPNFGKYAGKAVSVCFAKRLET